MKRREFNKLAGLAAAGMAIGGKCVAAEPPSSKKPNILFIMTDQQHARMMGCTGNKWLKTPAMDSLAAEGLRFEKAYCANPVCVPSRTSMATGVMPCRLGADDNGSGMKIKNLPPEVDENAIGKILKSAGYDTFYGGKVHMCRALTPGKAGYDEFCKDERDQLPEECVKFMTKKRKNPFFAVASFINPHDICFAHLATQGKNTHNVLQLYKEAKKLPLDELTPLPDNYEPPENEPSALADRPVGKAVTPSMLMRKTYDDREWRTNRWIYHRLTEKVDRNIGTILDGLKEAGLDENTLVIFTSDHGNMDASHRLASKGIFYEESVGVPFLMKYKGCIPAGRVDKESLVSSGLDILPTVCDYAGVEIPEHLLGRSLRPLAENKPNGSWRSYVASENGGTRMIRTQKYKYCVYLKTGEESLVDLEKDPGEMRNVAKAPRMESVIKEHRALLAEWSEKSKDKDAAQFLKNGINNKRRLT